MSSVPSKPLLLYVSAMGSYMGVLLSHNNEEGKEHVLYYLSCTMVEAKLNCSPIKKTCLALIFALKKLRHYLLTTTVHLISRVNPLKYIISQPSIQGHITKWTILLSEFDIHYIPQGVVKGQALVNFLASHLIPNDSPLQCYEGTDKKRLGNVL